MVPPNITKLNTQFIARKRLPRLRQKFGIRWQGIDINVYLNNLIIASASQQNLLRGLIGYFFARSSPKARERIYSKSINLYKSEYGIAIQEESITPDILTAVQGKIDPKQKYKFKDVLHLIFNESARTYQAKLGKATDKIELMALLDTLTEEEILPYQIKVVIKTDIIPALSDLKIPINIKISELRSSLIDIKKGKPVRRTEIERIIHGLREIAGSLPYEQKPEFYEMVKTAKDEGRIIEFLEEAYRLGILYEYARRSAILSIDEWISLRSTFANNKPFRNLILKEIATLNDAQHFILGYRILRISDLEEFIALKQKIEAVRQRMSHTDLDADVVRIIRRAINSIIKAGETAGQIQDYISEINRNGTQEHKKALEKILAQEGQNEGLTQTIENAIKDSGTAAIPALIEASVNVPRRIIKPLIMEITHTASNTEQEKEVYQALIETVKRSELDFKDPRIILATEILLDPENSKAIYYLLAEYAIIYKRSCIAHLPLIGMFSSLYKILAILLSLISKLLGTSPKDQRAISILGFLKEQAIAKRIDLPNKLLDLVINYLRAAQSSSTTVRNLIEDYDARSKDNLKTDPAPASEVLRDLGITRGIFIQALQVLSITELLEAEQFEEAREFAQDAAAFARRQNLITDVTYIPGFLAYSIGNEPRDKALEDLKTALRSDRGKGLFAAMGVVQNILKDETYTNLGNIIKELESEGLEPRVVVYGALLRTSKFSYERAKRILEAMQKDKDLWINLLDLIGTRQFEEAHRRIVSWLKQNLS